MTQENTAARDEARRLNDEASRGTSDAGAAMTDVTPEGVSTVDSSDSVQTFDPNATGGLGKPSWIRQMSSFHTKIVDGFSEVQSTPEKMLSAGTSAIWSGLFGMVGKAFKKGATGIGISEKDYDSWAGADNSKSTVSEQLEKDFDKAYAGGKDGLLSMGDGLLGVLSLCGVNITNLLDTPTQANTQVADATNSTPGVNPTVQVGRNNAGRG